MGSMLNVDGRFKFRAVKRELLNGLQTYIRSQTG
jgi:hypothetical protein